MEDSFLTPGHILRAVAQLIPGVAVRGIFPYSFVSSASGSQWTKPKFSSSPNTVWLYVGYVDTLNKTVFFGTALNSPSPSAITWFTNFFDGTTPMGNSLINNPINFYGFLIDIYEAAVSAYTGAPSISKAMVVVGGNSDGTVSFSLTAVSPNNTVISVLGTFNNVGSYGGTFAVGQNVNLSLLDVNGSTTVFTYVVSSGSLLISSVGNLTSLTGLLTCEFGGLQAAAFAGVVGALGSLTALTQFLIYYADVSQALTPAFNQAVVVLFFNTLVNAASFLPVIGTACKAVLSSFTVVNSSMVAAPRFQSFPALTNVILNNNALTVAVVNQVLQDLDGGGLSNGVCNLAAQTPAASPTGAGVTSKANLIGKGWTVTTD